MAFSARWRARAVEPCGGSQVVVLARMQQPQKRHIATLLLDLLLQLRWIFIERFLRCRMFPISPKFGISTVPGRNKVASVTIGDFIVIAPLSTLVGYGIKSTLFDNSPRESGLAAWYSVVATVLLANKSTSLLAMLFGMSWERLIPIHSAAAWIAVWNSFLHGYACYMYTAAFDGGIDVEAPSGETVVGHSSTPMNATFVDSLQRTAQNDQYSESIDIEGYFFHGDQPDLFRYLIDGAVCISGTVMALCLLSLVGLSAVRWCRQHNFDLWLINHIVLSIAIACASLVHAANYSKLIFLWWAVDAFLRHVVHPSCTSPRSATLSKVGKDVVEIRFQRPRLFYYKAGQFVRIAVKELGVLQFHPVTISSAPWETHESTVHFRVRGNWTQKLKELADTSSPSKPATAMVTIQGPFGSPMLNLDDYRRYPHVLLICGGIGVTPMRSIVRQLMYTHHRLGHRRYKIHLVWAVPNADTIDHLAILIDSEDLQLIPSVSLRSDDTHPDIEATIGYPPPRQSSVFQGDIYLTKSCRAPRWRDERFRLHYNQRPDPDAILQATCRTITELQQKAFVSCLSHVAVHACGPPTLVHATKEACHTYNNRSNGSAFHFHEEIFDY